MRHFVYDRFLARVFHDLDAPWVLKGGTAVLARVNDARTTKDVDLLVELDNLDIALERLRASVAVDLGDHFGFVITGNDASGGGAGQPQVGGYRVQVDAYCGAVKKQTFSVDAPAPAWRTSIRSPGKLESAVPTYRQGRARMRRPDDLHSRHGVRLHIPRPCSESIRGREAVGSR